MCHDGCNVRVLEVITGNALPGHGSRVSLDGTIDDQTLRAASTSLGVRMLLVTVAEYDTQRSGSVKHIYFG